MNKVDYGSFTDSRDGKTYKTVKIGEQVWMAENLNYEAQGSLCYDNDNANCAKYGRLYNWETAKEVCPSGWHLPSEDEWKTLINVAGGDEAGKNLKAANGWNSDGEDSGNGTDDYGFSALPGGIGDSDGSFSDVGYDGYWWSSSECNSSIAYGPYMNNLIELVYSGSCYKSYLRSVRCVQD
jgi:uncharacterized protein (TIGR02145 family)